MATVLLVLVVVLVIAALVFGVVTLLSGDDPGLVTIEPDGRALPLPNNRSLSELDLKTVRFDVELRGYRMAQVDRVLRRTAYDIGYKDEMIAVLEAEVIALREGRTEDAELLRKARESAASPSVHAVTGDPNPGAHRAAEAGDDADHLGLTVRDDSAADPDFDEPETGPSAKAKPAADTADPGAETAIAGGGAESATAGGEADDDERREDEKRDREHTETEERLDEDIRPAITEEPTRDATGDVDIPEERATRG